MGIEQEVSAQVAVAPNTTVRVNVALDKVTVISNPNPFSILVEIDGNGNIVERSLRSDFSSPMDPRPRRSRVLSALARYLPTEMEDHKEEIQQFAEDGIIDRASRGRSVKWFILSEVFSQAALIVKTSLLAIHKPRRHHNRNRHLSGR